MNFKYYSVPIKVVSVGYISVKVPEHWTEEQIKEFASVNFFVSPYNVEQSKDEPIEAMKPTEIWEVEFGRQKATGDTADFCKNADWYCDWCSAPMLETEPSVDRPESETSVVAYCSQECVDAWHAAH